MKGAEAVLRKSTLLSRNVVIKQRIKKNYRVPGLDIRLRRERTRAEARLLHKAKLAGVACPTVLEVDEFALAISFIEGDHPEMNKAKAKRAGEMLASLHSAGIIHGDFTPVNLMEDKAGRLLVIDFGLGFFSSDIEDMAIDVYTMMKALDKKTGEAFIKGYCLNAGPKADSVLKRLKNVEKRVRYAQ